MLSGTYEIKKTKGDQMNKAPEWINKSPEEIENLVIELREKENSPSEIGTILRDQYGVPNVNEILDKSILEILEEHEAAPNIPEELRNLMKKAVKLRNHLEKNKKDLVSKRTLKTLESRIHKLTKYYRRKGRLPADWRYDPEKAALLVRG